MGPIQVTEVDRLEFFEVWSPPHISVTTLGDIEVQINRTGATIRGDGPEGQILAWGAVAIGVIGLGLAFAFRR